MMRQAILFRRVWAAAGLLALLLVGGCGETVYVPSEADKIKDLVSHLPDGGRSTELFAARFASGAAAPEKDRARYTKYTFRAPDPDISGETATATVDIISPFTDKPLGTAEWTFTRQNGQWLLQTAPLPADLPPPQP